MTFDIPKEKWTEFLNDLSRRRFGWETRIEVISENLGDQILSSGLPLTGVTFQDRAGMMEIEILVGEGTSHQAHSISNPSALSYLSEPDHYRGLLEIEEANGTKTLLSLIDPMPVQLGYAAFKIVAAS